MEASRTLKRTAPTSRGVSAYSRKRAVIACQVCRARRTKCDQKKPRCSFCESVGAECVSDVQAMSSFDPASLAIIERLDGLERELKCLTRWQTQNQSPCGLSSSSWSWNPRPRSEPALPPTLECMLSWPVFQADASAEFPPAHFPSPAADACARSDLRQSVQARLMGPESVEIKSIHHLELTDRFFADVHTRNPILDEAKTRVLARDVYERGVRWDAETCLALLVWANGALARPFPGSPAGSENVDEELGLEREYEKGLALFYAAEQRFGCLFAAAGVLQGQCFFLAGVFLMAVLRPLDAWRLFVNGLSICRVVKRTAAGGSVGSNSADQVALESVYWSLWKSERELNRELELGGSCPSSAPPEYFACLPAKCGEDDLRTWYFYLSEISAWRLETYVEETISCPNSRSLYLQDLVVVADNLRQQIAEWQNSLAARVYSRSSDVESDIGMLPLIIRARILYIRDLISWPFVHALLHHGAPAAPQPQSPAVKAWTEAGLSCHLSKLLNHKPQFYYRHHGTWLMLRSCARSAFILLGAARLRSAEPLLPPGWRAAVADTLEMLKFWQPQVNELQSPIQRLQVLFYSL
ncbi:hypothetical protein BDV11DRAFT_173223 [Aspergillus similis]